MLSLIQAGASPNAKNNKEESLFFHVFRIRDDKTSELLQDKYKGDMNTQAKEKKHWLIS